MSAAGAPALNPRLPSIDLFPQATARDAWVSLEFSAGNPAPTRAAAQLIVALLSHRADWSLDLRGDSSGQGTLTEWLAGGTPEERRTVQVRKIPESRRPV